MNTIRNRKRKSARSTTTCAKRSAVRTSTRSTTSMGFDLPEDEDFDTIGGFVFAEFGRVPAVGESITWQDAVRVTVLEASRRRVNRVRLERVRKESLEMAQRDS